VVQTTHSPSVTEFMNELELYLCIPTVPVEAYHWVTFTFTYTCLRCGMA